MTTRGLLLLGGIAVCWMAYGAVHAPGWWIYPVGLGLGFGSVQLWSRYFRYVP
ncbi:MAG TPA: hypothetical protein VMF63_03495 [Opitutaceae bacterium]|nr:hypothetical protein [Opitutaceae bacterium]